MITRRSWIVMAVTVLLGIITAIVWISTRNPHCVDVGTPRAALRRPQTRAGRPHLLRVQDDDSSGDDPMPDPVNPPAPGERDLQEAQRKADSPCGAYLDNMQTWRLLTLIATGAGVLGSAVSLYFDNEAKKRHRRRRRRRRLPVA